MTPAKKAKDAKVRFTKNLCALGAVGVRLSPTPDFATAP